LYQAGAQLHKIEFWNSRESNPDKDASTDEETNLVKHEDGRGEREGEGDDEDDDDDDDDDEDGSGDVSEGNSLSALSRRRMVATHTIKRGEQVLDIPLKYTMNKLTARNVKVGKGGYLGKLPLLSGHELDGKHQPTSACICLAR
jgi:hypothetical protein